MAFYAITVDFPPSTNTYFTVIRGRKALSGKAQKYKRLVRKQIISQLGPKPKKLTGRLRIQIELSRFDNRDFDIANFEKCLTDCMSDFLYVDDSQFDEVLIKRLPVSSEGFARVLIDQIPRSISSSPEKTVRTKKKATRKRVALKRIEDRITRSGKRS